MMWWQQRAEAPWYPSKIGYEWSEKSKLAFYS